MQPAETITLKNWGNYSKKEDENRFVEGDFILRADLTGARPHFYLFATEKYAGDQLWIDMMPHNAPILFQQVLDQHAPHLKLHDADWDYIDFQNWNKFEFTGRHNETCTMFRTHTFLYFNGLKDPRKRMQAVIDDPVGKGQELFDDPTYIKQSDHLIVPIPLHPLKHLMMIPRMSARAGSDFEVVLCDPQKFMGFWQASARGKKPKDLSDGLAPFFKFASEMANPEDLMLMGTDLPKAISNVSPHHGHPGKPAFIGFNIYKTEPRVEFGPKSREEGHWGFVDGRHRTVNLNRLGAPFIPIELTKDEDLNLFISLFEWTGAKRDDLDSRPAPIGT